MIGIGKIERDGQHRKGEKRDDAIEKEGIEINAGTEHKILCGVADALF